MIMIPRRLTAASLAALLACSAAPAQDSVPTSVPGAPAAPASSTAPALTLEQCIQRALQRNFDLEIGRYNPEIAKDSIEAAKGVFQPQLSVSGATGEFSTPGNNSRTSNLRVGVAQELPTGTTVSASSRLDRSS